jgi:hypothetical protein
LFSIVQPTQVPLVDVKVTGVAPVPSFVFNVEVPIGVTSIVLEPVSSVPGLAPVNHFAAVVVGVVPAHELLAMIAASARMAKSAAAPSLLFLMTYALLRSPG